MFGRMNDSNEPSDASLPRRWMLPVVRLAVLVLLAVVGCSAEPEKPTGADAAVDAQSSADAALGGEDADAGVADAGPVGAHLAAVVPETGPTAGLTEVVLQGAGLSTATAVWFGDSKALDLQLLDDGSLRCRTPPHPTGPVEVTVLRMEDGIPLPELSLPFGFRYVPTMTVTRVLPETGPTTGGTLVTVEGSGFVPGTHFVFGDRVAITPQIVDEFSATLILPPHAAGKVAVTASNTEGQFVLEDAFTYGEGPQPPMVEGVSLAWIDPVRLDPAGGTGFELRYAAPTALGKLLGVRIGPLAAAQLGPGQSGPQSATGVAPAGSPGPAEVVLIFADGEAHFPDAVSFASDKPRLVAVLPGRGGQAGGTLVDLVGDGMDLLSYARFGEKPGIGNEVAHAGLVRVRTPPAEGVGVVPVIAYFKGAGQSLLKRGFVYYDPAQEAFGTWGSPIDRAINITVMRADWPGGIVADALVVIGDGSDASLRGHTDQRGQVVISALGLHGPLDVSASKPGYGAATIAGTDAENATLLIRKYPEQGGGEPFVWPKKFYGNGTIEGRVMNHGKYAGLPRGRCAADAPAGSACSPCGGGVGCDAGLDCVAADAEIWPPAPATATATGLCLQPCAKTDECGVGDECRYVTLPEGLTSTAACLPRVGVPQTRCETTKKSRFADNPDPGSGAIVAADGSFSLQSRLGSIAVACRAGYVDATSGAFVPLWLGVARSVELPDDVKPIKADVVIDTKLARDATIRASGLPVGPDSAGTKRLALVWLDLGGEGLLPMAEEVTTARRDTFRLRRLPTALTGALSGLRYQVWAGLTTVGADEENPLSLGQFIDQQFAPNEGFVWWPAGETGPILADSGALPARAAATGKAGIVAAGPAGRILLWSGGSWTPQQSPTTADLAAVWLDADSVDGWIGGADGVLLRRKPVLGWQRAVSPTAARVVGLAGASANDVWLLDAAGVLHRWQGKGWTVAPAGSWTGETPTALRRLTDGTLAVTTEAGRIHLGTGVVLPGGALQGVAWQPVAVQADAPLYDVDGKSPTNAWAVGARGALLRLGKTGAYLVTTPTEDALLGVRTNPTKGVDSAASIVGARGVWLEVNTDGAGKASVVEVGPTGLSTDLFSIVREGYFSAAGSGAPTLGSAAIAVGEPVLGLERWLEMAKVTQPPAGEAFDTKLRWTWPGGALGDLQVLQVTTFFKVPYWEIVTTPDRKEIDLPDFYAIGGWQPLPGGPLWLRVHRAYSPGLGVDHFNHDQLGWWSWTTWSTAQIATFVAGSP
ncbi:MAG: IPT/TIG domain-containing protein [Deltaproteobacteria bacterium]|nr:IPT/TIG domain-containing protein [Deltaproteobacteria bacterium]